MPLMGVSRQLTIYETTSLMNIHGLIYSLEEVSDWIEVQYLVVYRPPDKKMIADRAWINPKTIHHALIQEYKTIDRHRPKPIAWGFGPKKSMRGCEYEMAGFVFANTQDYYKVLDYLK